MILMLIGFRPQIIVSLKEIISDSFLDIFGGLREAFSTLALRFRVSGVRLVKKREH